MRIIQYSYLHEDAIKIRKKVFIEEQGFQDEFDNNDFNSIHFVMYNENNIAIATCRVYQDNSSKDYIIGRFAVLTKYRGLHLGKNLMLAVENYLKSKNVQRVILHAQYQACNFYQKCGFVAFKEIDFEEDCPHIWMQKNI